MTDLFARIGDQKVEITLNSKSEIVVNKKKYSVELIHLKNGLYQLNIDGKPHQLLIDQVEIGQFHTIIHGEEFDVNIQTALAKKASQLLKKKNNNNSNKNIIAPMNGLVVKINKKIGEVVKVGDSLIVLEAMKMENEIKAASAGTIKTIKCQIGKSVNKGEVLFIIS